MSNLQFNISVFFVHLTDHKSTAETGHELMRPFLHEFLMSAYEDYDIVIWCEYRDGLGRHLGENNKEPNQGSWAPRVPGVGADLTLEISGLKT